MFDQGQKRHENGLHLVEPETIKTMYSQTIPLFKENFEVVDEVTFIDVDELKGLKIIATFNKAELKTKVFDNPPAWFSDHLT
jgi:predicted ABC-type ATPase